MVTLREEIETGKLALDAMSGRRIHFDFKIDDGGDPIGIDGGGYRIGLSQVASIHQRRLLLRRSCVIDGPQLFRLKPGILMKLIEFDVNGELTSSVYFRAEEMVFENDGGWESVVLSTIRLVEQLKGAQC